MLQLALVGGNSASKIKELINKNFDYVKVLVFPSISDFSSAVESRAITVDRLILLQDALTDDITADTLHSFDNFLNRHYPSVRLISIMSNRASAMLMSSVFISPFSIHMLMDKMKPRVLSDLVADNPNVLKEKYGFKPNVESSDDVIQEVIETMPDATDSSHEVSPTPPDNPTPLSGVVPPHPQQVGVSDKKKRGLFSMFGGKKTKSDKKGKRNKKDRRTNGSLPSTGESPKSYTPYDTGSDPIINDHVEDTSTYEEDPTAHEVDFSMFGDDSQVGIGAEVSKHYPSTPAEETTTSEEAESESTDFSVFDTAVPSTADEEFQDTDSTDFDDEESPTSPSYEPEESSSIGLDLDDIGGESDLLAEVSSSDNVGVNTEELNSRLAELANSVFSKEISLDVAGVKTPVSTPTSITVSDVEEETPLFDDDVAQLSEQYDEQNVKVVEKTVERVVEVNGSKRHYRNGIRVIVVTGDRKTGVTHTALTLASHYGKGSRTLYVDFDLARRGSLLYLGLDNIADEEERVQNGLQSLNSVNALQYITHYFREGGFDCLSTIYGVEVDNARLSNVQHVLQSQRTYSTIVVDCPLENLHLLKDMLLYSEVLVCTESNMAGVLNTVLGLAEVFPDYDFSSFLYNNGQYFLSKDNDVNLFRENLEYVSESFSLDEEDINWGTMRLLGTCADYVSVVAQL